MPTTTTSNKLATLASYSILTGASPAFIRDNCVWSDTDDPVLTVEGYQTFLKTVRSQRRSLKSHQAGSRRSNYHVVPEDYDVSDFIEPRSTVGGREWSRAFPPMTDELYQSQFPSSSSNSSTPPRSETMPNNIPRTQAATEAPRGRTNSRPSSRSPSTHARGRGIPSRVDVDALSEDLSASTLTNNHVRNIRDVSDLAGKDNIDVVEIETGCDNPENIEGIPCTIEVKKDNGALVQVKCFAIVYPLTGAAINADMHSTSAELVIFKGKLAVLFAIPESVDFEHHEDRALRVAGMIANFSPLPHDITTNIGLIHKSSKWSSISTQVVTYFRKWCTASTNLAGESKKTIKYVIVVPPEDEVDSYEEYEFQDTDLSGIKYYSDLYLHESMATFKKTNPGALMCKVTVEDDDGKVDVGGEEIHLVQADAVTVLAISGSEEDLTTGTQVSVNVDAAKVRAKQKADKEAAKKAAKQDPQSDNSFQSNISSNPYMLKFKLENKNYYQFCGNCKQFQAAQDFWKQEGVEYFYAKGEQGESQLELTQLLCTKGNDYMVPGGGSFSAQWRRQCIEWKLKVEDDARSKPTASANAAAAKRADAAEKRARDALPEEDQQWIGFILDLFGSKIDDTVNPTATDQNADTNSADAQDDDVQDRTAEEMEEEVEEKKECDAADANASTDETPSNVRAHINKFEDLAAAAAAAAAWLGEDDVPPQEAEQNVKVKTKGPPPQVDTKQGEDTPPQVDTKQGEDAPPQEEAEENVETKKNFFENFRFQKFEELASRQSSVLQSLPESLRLAFDADDKNMLMEAFNAMTPEERNHHEQRMIECRLLFNPNIKPPLSPAKGMSPRSDVKTTDREKHSMKNHLETSRAQRNHNYRKKREEAFGKMRNKNTPDVVKGKINWMEELRKKAEEKSGKGVTFDETVTQTHVEILD